DDAPFHSPTGQGGRGAGRCPLGDDRRYCRCLHQYPDGQALSHAQREARHAREGMTEFMTTVYRQMRLVTLVDVSLYLLNGLLLASVTGLALWLWLQASIGVGAVAVAVGLVLRLWSMSQWSMWEISALFENIGTVQD